MTAIRPFGYKMKERIFSYMLAIEPYTKEIVRVTGLATSVRVVLAGKEGEVSSVETVWNNPEAEKYVSGLQEIVYMIQRRYFGPEEVRPH